MPKDALGRSKPAKIGKVSVILPDTPEGLAKFEKQMIRFNTGVLECALSHIDAPASMKLAYVKRMNGVVPWAEDAGRIKKELEEE